MDESAHSADHPPLTFELLRDWARHPVTRLLAVVIAAHLAKELVLKHGLRLAFPEYADADREI
jgi:hypothetical protein